MARLLSTGAITLETYGKPSNPCRKIIRAQA
jgi:hypothetical protein